MKTIIFKDARFTLSDIDSIYMTRCINHPKRKANTWTGHLHAGHDTGSIVTAGFCSKKCYEAIVFNGCSKIPSGCVGIISGGEHK